MTAPWADAHVDVTLNYGNIDRELAVRLVRSIKTAERAARASFQRMERDARTSSMRVADHWESAFDRIRRAAARNIELKITVESAVSPAQIRAIRERIRQQLGSASVTVDIDTTRMLTQLRTAHAAMQTWLRANPLSARLTVDASLADLAAMHAAMQAWLRANPLSQRVTVDVDQSALSRLTRSLSSMGRSSGGSRIGSMFSSITSGAVSAASTVARFTAIATTATVAVGGAMPAVAALGAALGSTLVAGAGAAAAGLAAVGLAAGSLAAGLGGVGGAFSAMGKSASGGGGAAVDTAKQIEKAEYQLSRAVQDEEDAQKDVTRAREDARKKLRDLDLQMRGAALSERDAQLDLQDAKAELAAGDFKNSRERARAVLRVDQAEQRLLETQRDNSDLAQDAATARAKGVEGSDEVVDAQKRLADATHSVKEAQDALNEARNPAGGGGGGSDPFAEAMAKLSTNAQAFVRAVQAIKPAWDDMKKTVQDSLFAGIAEQVQPLADNYIPRLGGAMRTVADGFNEGAISALNFLNSTTGLSVMDTLLGNSSNMAANMGSALGNLVPGILAIGASSTSVFGPLTDGIAASARGLSDMLVQAQQSGRLDAFFQNALTVARQLGGVLSELGNVIGGVFRAASAAGGGNFLGGLTNSLAAVANWVNGPGQQALTSFFQSMQAAMGAVLPIFLQVAGIIGGTIAPAIAGLITQIAPAISGLIGGIGQGLAAIAPVMPILGNAISSIATALTPVMPILGQLIAKIVEFAGPIISSLATALGPVIEAIGNGLIAAFTALQPAVGPITDLFQTLSPILAQIATILGQVLAEAITALVPSISTIANVFGQVLTAISPLLPVLGDALVQAIQILAPMIKTMAEAWTEVIPSLLQIIPPLIQIVQALLPPLLEIIGAMLPLIPGLASAFLSMVPAMMPLINIVLQLVTWFAQLLGVILSFAAKALAVVTEAVVGMVTGFTNFVTTVSQAISGFVSDVVGFFFQLGVDTWNAAVALWDKVSTAFSQGVSTAVGWVTGIKDKVVDAFKDAGKWLYDAGRTVVQGLINGLKSMLSAIGNAIVNLFPGPIKGAVRSALGLFTGGLLPGYATGGTVGMAPGTFIVNAAASRRNKPLLKALGGRTISGPGTGTSDSITAMWKGRPLARVSRGEIGIPPQIAGPLLPLLSALNSGANLRGLLPGFVDGGLIRKLRESASQIVHSGYVWGGWGNGWNTDCSGAASSLANMATGKSQAPGEGERTATGGMAAFLQARGFQPGLGPDGSLRIGWSDSHANSQLPTGENVEHTGPEGAPGLFGSQADGPDSLPNQMHLPMGGDPSGTAGASPSGSSPSLTSTAPSSTPIGSGIGGSSWGNSGGSSKINSAAEAKKNGITPVWVENWPSSMGGGGGGGLTSTPTDSGDLTTATTTSTGSGADTIPLKQNPDGTWSSTDPAWDHLMQRESGGKADIVQQVQDANSGGNEASGLFQIAKQTWASNGGTQYAPTAGEATPQQQAEIAAKIFNEAGGAPWGAGMGGRESEEELRKGIQRGGTQATPAPLTTTPTTPTETTPTTTPALTTTTPTAPATPSAPEQTEYQPEEFKPTGTNISGNVGGLAETGVKNLLDGFIHQTPGLLGGYDNTTGTSLGTRFGGVANKFVEGQLGSALGIVGIDELPPAIQAIGQYMSDNPKSDKDADKKNLTDLAYSVAQELIAAGLGAVNVYVDGGDPDAVVTKLNQAQRRKARRYVKQS